MKTLWTLQPEEFASLKSEGSSVIGTLRNPEARDLYHDFGTRLRVSGENDAVYLCWGSVKIIVGDGLRHDPRPERLPVCLKRAALFTSGEQIKASVSEDEAWQFNPPLSALLSERGIAVPPDLAANPTRATSWLETELQHSASEVVTEAYIGLSAGNDSFAEPLAAEEAETLDVALAS
jgi:hypothetical protein